MKTAILAGGYGTRLSEYTKAIPKPMTAIGDKPILWHIMNWYASFGHKDFIVALGYKAEVIRKYFLDYRVLSENCSIDLGTGDVTSLETDRTGVDWQVSLIDTGLDTMTGGRVRRLAPYLGAETFMITYGDGVADIDLSALLKFHRSHGKLVTMTAVRPGARFGELELDGNKIVSFEEKPQLNQGWVNGGFFVVEPQFVDLIESDEIMLERGPLETAAAAGELMAYKHHGFWQCMDTKRDHESLQALWSSGRARWKTC